jgi:hypothetical protein
MRRLSVVLIAAITVASVTLGSGVAAARVEPKRPAAPKPPPRRST